MYKQSTMSFASTLHPGVFDAAANTETEKSKSDAMAMKLDTTYNRLFDAKPDERLLIDSKISLRDSLFVSFCSSMLFLLPGLGFYGSSIL